MTDAAGALRKWKGEQNEREEEMRLCDSWLSVPTLLLSSVSLSFPSLTDVMRLISGLIKHVMQFNWNV